jgi:hypothetical protein
VLEGKAYFLEKMGESAYALIEIVLTDGPEAARRNELALFHDDSPLAGLSRVGDTVVFFSKTRLYCWDTSLKFFPFPSNSEPFLKVSAGESMGYDGSLSPSFLSLPFHGSRSHFLLQGRKGRDSGLFMWRPSVPGLQFLPLKGWYSFTSHGEVVATATDGVVVYEDSAFSKQSIGCPNLKKQFAPFKHEDVLVYFCEGAARVVQCVLASGNREASFTINELGDVSDLRVELLPHHVYLMYLTPTNQIGVALWHISE